MKSDPVREYWEKRFDAGVSLATVGWLGLGDAFNRWMYRVRRSVFLSTARPYVSPGTRVLDVGSGTGFYLERWRELGAASITGSDFTDAVTSTLRKRYGFPIISMDIGAAELPLSQRFDIVSAMDVLFHIVDDDRYRQSFVNFARLLEPNGTLIFTDNCVHEHANRSEHQVSRTLQQTQDALERAGFSIVSRRPAFVLMNTPVDSRSRAMHRYWNLMRRAAATSDVAANAIGAALYAPELFLTRTLREGPSTEILVCRRSG